MQDWVEHPVGPFDLPVREFPNLLDDRVPVAFPLLKNPQDNRGRRSCVQFLVDLH